MLLIAGQLYYGYRNPLILIASVFFLSICYTDMLYAKVPNAFNLGLLLAGFGYNYYLSGISGLALALLGAVLGLLLFLLPYIAGGMGAGDVKALAALGSLAGPIGIFNIFLYTALIGGGLAILYLCFSCNFWQKLIVVVKSLRTYLYTKDISVLQPDRTQLRQKFPYAAAIALGFFSYVKWGPITTLLRQ